MGKYLSKPGAAKQLQEALIARGYSCGPSGADGILGPDSQAAIVAFRRDHPPLTPSLIIDNEMLRQLGLGPALITEPGTLGNIIALPIIELALSFILKGLPVNNIFNTLSGAKTYITGVIMILIGAADYAGWNIPGTLSWPAAGWIAAGLLAIAGRNALATSVVAIIEKLGGVDPANLPK